MKRNGFILLILIAVGIFSANAQTSKELKTAIIDIGCRQIKQSDLKPMSISVEDLAKWQSDLRIQSKQSWIAKCRASDGLFYKFLFEKEIFANETDAKARLPKIREIPPNENDKSDVSAPIILREGFQKGNNIYTVGAFAAKLESSGDVKKWKERLEKKVR